MKIALSSIGTVHNAVHSKKDTGWGDEISQIALDECYRDGLQGLSSFSHIIVVTYLHQAQFDIEKHLQRRPQGRPDMPLVGILSQRAKDRPNPIGITAVELVSVHDQIVTVLGLDAVDGTPVLDIKPYYPKYDCRENARVPEWVVALMEHYF